MSRIASKQPKVMIEELGKGLFRAVWGLDVFRRKKTTTASPQMFRQAGRYLLTVHMFCSKSQRLPNEVAMRSACNYSLAIVVAIRILPAGRVCPSLPFHALFNSEQ